MSALVRAARPRAASAALVVAALAYGWWISGVPAFSAQADLAIAPPVAALVALALLPRRKVPSRSHPPARGRWPLTGLVLLAAAVTLECVALGLGGRSPGWPTLSTILDRPLGTRAGRYLAFEFWFFLGASRYLARIGALR